MGGNELFITLPYTEFQPTHPVWGETNYTDTSRHGVTISIHPSRVGWDLVCLLPASFLMHFNPPIPCGMGQMQMQPTAVSRYFNPPIPCGMGRSQNLSEPITKNFNPPIPCGMGRGLRGTAFRALHYFNPPIPCGMGLDPFRSSRSKLGISIHPSRVGWDRHP